MKDKILNLPYEYVIVFMLPVITYWIAGGNFDRSFELAITFVLSVIITVLLYAFKHDGDNYLKRPTH